ncbi:hypothetical protein SISNIDRAFT_474178 [Sistotremastrum niveocremeum HHB9708]|uniref:Reverse transcriptase domain-containing protein n=1 Tax=Sistotremastrum niveocremeum HHB9708 TaxID=1314777 RepID=A0A164VJZ9_9AGAM|nr:hypothetical protein SISNIDRAFT_474178 [Sistotremastrum niveocremeum HHB9708]
MTLSRPIKMDFALEPELSIISSFFADPDDISLSSLQIPIPILAHADDLLTISLSPSGLQRRLTTITSWCSSQFLLINAGKSYAMAFGPLPSVLPRLLIHDVALEWKDIGRYLGALVQSSQRDIFAPHYRTQGSKSASTGALIGAIQNAIGPLLIQDALLLYKARVDPILTYGCEIMPDVTPSSLYELQSSQRQFIRNRLGLPANSLIAPLYTETGLWPIQYRRLDLTLRYLMFLRELPPSRLAAIAFQDQRLLASAGSPCWFTDLRNITKLLSPNILPFLSYEATLLRPDIHDFIQQSVTSSLSFDITSSHKLHLLRSLRFYNKNGILSDPRTSFTPSLQPYMLVARSSHRDALIRLLFSAHHYATETLRHRNRRRPPIPYNQRLCRFCALAIEDESHALLVCKGDSELMLLRSHFLTKIRQICSPQTIR